MDVEREYNAIQEDVSSELRWAKYKKHSEFQRHWLHVDGVRFWIYWVNK